MTSEAIDVEAGSARAGRRCRAARPRASRRARPRTGCRRRSTPRAARRGGRRRDRPSCSPAAASAGAGSRAPACRRPASAASGARSCRARAACPVPPARIRRTSLHQMSYSLGLIRRRARREPVDRARAGRPRTRLRPSSRADSRACRSIAQQAIDLAVGGPQPLVGDSRPAASLPDAREDALDDVADRDARARCRG